MKELYENGVTRESDKIEKQKLIISNAEVVLKTEGIDEFSTARLGKAILQAKNKIQDLLYNKIDDNEIDK